MFTHNVIHINFACRDFNSSLCIRNYILKICCIAGKVGAKLKFQVALIVKYLKIEKIFGSYKCLCENYVKYVDVEGIAETPILYVHVRAHIMYSCSTQVWWRTICRWSVWLYDSVVVVHTMKFIE